MNIKNLQLCTEVLNLLKSTTATSVAGELKNFPSYGVRHLSVGPTLLQQIADNFHGEDATYSIRDLYKNRNEWCRAQASFYDCNVFDGRRVGGMSLSHLTTHGLLPTVVMEFCSVKKKDDLRLLERAGNESKGLNKRVKYLAVCGKGKSPDDEFDASTNAEVESDVKREIRKMKKENDSRTLHILSMGMGSRSFSVSEIEVTIIGIDGGSENTAQQKSLRSMTEGALWNGKLKTRGTVLLFSIDSNRKKERLATLYKFILSDSIASKGSDTTVPLDDGLRQTFNAYDIQLMDTEDGSYRSLTAEEEKAALSPESVISVYEEVMKGGYNSDAVFVGEDEIIDEIGSEKPKVPEGPRPQIPTKKNGRKTGENSGIPTESSDKIDLRKRAFERIVFTVGNVYYSLLDLIGEKQMPTSYYDALLAYPSNDAEIRGLLGTTPENVAKLVKNGSLGLREDYLTEIFRWYSRKHF